MHKAIAFIFNNLNKLKTDLLNEVVLTKIIHFLPLIVLFCNFCLYYLWNRIYNIPAYDEFVLRSISFQPLSQLFDTIQAEPHPPGFYLYLKILHRFFSSFGAEKIVSMVFFYLTILSGVFIVYKHKLFSLKSLSVFFASAIFLEISILLKQDILSFPLYFLLFCLLTLIIKQGEILLVHFLSITIILITLSLLGFLPCMFGMISTALVVVNHFYHTKKIEFPLLFSLLFGALSLIIYFATFGKLQFANNYVQQNRFQWTTTINNNSISALSEYIFGAQPINIYTDIMIALFVVLIFFSLLEYLKKLRFHTLSSLETYLVLSFSTFLFLSYTLRLFVQIRYSLPFFLLTCLFVGNTLDKMKKKLLFLTLFFLFFQLRSYVYIRAGISLYLTEQNFREEIQKAINSDATGILSNYPLSSVFVKMKFFPQSKNIHALSLSLKSRVVADNVIDKELLRIDGQSVEDDITTIQKKIASTQLKNFIFFDFHDKFFQNYDPKQKILLSIMNNCRRTTILSGFSNNRIYHFKECEFSK